MGVEGGGWRGGGGVSAVREREEDVFEETSGFG